MVVTGYLWLLMVLYGGGCFGPVLDGSGRFWCDMWIDFTSSAWL